MQLNPNGLVVTVVFFGLLWFALEPGAVDSASLRAVLAIALKVMFGWLLFGAISEWQWPRRRVSK